MLIMLSFVKLRIWCEAKIVKGFYRQLKRFLFTYILKLLMFWHIRRRIFFYYILWQIQFVATFTKNHNPWASERSVNYTSLQLSYLCKLLIGLIHPQKKSFPVLKIIIRNWTNWFNSISHVKYTSAFKKVRL